MADFLFTDLLASLIVWYYLCILCTFIYYSVSIINILKYALFIYYSVSIISILKYALFAAAFATINCCSYYHKFGNKWPHKI